MSNWKNGDRILAHAAVIGMHPFQPANHPLPFLLKVPHSNCMCPPLASTVSASEWAASMRGWHPELPAISTSGSNMHNGSVIAVLPLEDL